MEEKVIENKAGTDEISLKELIVKSQQWLKFILSKWRIILLFGILGACLGLTYAYLKPNVYTATTTFVLESGDSRGGLGQYAGLASMVGIDVGGGGGNGIFQGDNIIELYRSRKMLEKTLLTETVYEGKKQLLVDRYINFNRLRDSWAKKGLNNINFQKKEVKDKKLIRLQDSILGTITTDIIKNYLSVAKPDKKLSIIKVDVSAKDEFFAKVFNDELVANVNDFYIQTKTKKATENVVILMQKTDSVRSVMNGAIYSAAVVADATPNLNLTRQVQRVAPVQRSQFNAETNKVILGELVKNLELSKISLLKETPLIQVIDNPIFPLEKTHFSKAIGILLGGFIGGITTVLVLVFKKFFKSIMGD